MCPTAIVLTKRLKSKATYLPGTSMTCSSSAFTLTTCLNHLGMITTVQRWLTTVYCPMRPLQQVLEAASSDQAAFDSLWTTMHGSKHNGIRKSMTICTASGSSISSTTHAQYLSSMGSMPPSSINIGHRTGSEKTAGIAGKGTAGTSAAGEARMQCFGRLFKSTSNSSKHNDSSSAGQMRVSGRPAHHVRATARSPKLPKAWLSCPNFPGLAWMLPAQRLRLLLLHMLHISRKLQAQP